MSRDLAAGVGAATLIVAVGLGWYLFGGSEALPQPHAPAHKEVFPELDFRAASPGSDIDRIYASFGRQPPHRDDGVSSTRCVVFAYDEELFDGALVVLARDSLIAERWIMKGKALPNECSALPSERVSLSGWYAAAVR